MTQPAVTFQVRQLEEHFDTRLFDRTHNRVTLTDVGHVVYEISERMFELYDEMDRRVKEMTGEVGGSLNIGASTTIAENMLPALLGKFRVKHRDLAVRLKVGNTEAIVSMVEHNVVDLAMLMAEMTGRERYKAEAGGLGFAYDFAEKTVGIIVDWHGKRALQVIAHLGDWAYTAALGMNRWFNVARRQLGYPYWSLSQWLKRQVKEAVKAIDRFETALAAEARRRDLDGVICGHIHHAEMREIQGVLYMNDGDWVESCTALVEHADGRFELVDWARENKLSFYASRRSPPVPAIG